MYRQYENYMQLVYSDVIFSKTPIHIATVAPCNSRRHLPDLASFGMLCPWCLKRKSHYIKPLSEVSL
jgi:hypothetical protein